jgi:hypothetical protein
MHIFILKKSGEFGEKSVISTTTCDLLISTYKKWYDREI